MQAILNEKRKLEEEFRSSKISNSSPDELKQLQEKVITFGPKPEAFYSVKSRFTVTLDSR